MTSTGDRDATIMAMLIARAWRDSDFRNALLGDPRSILDDEGFEIPPDTEISVLEDTPTVKHIALGRDVTDAKEALALLQHVIPMPEGLELRLFQNTYRHRYLVLPTVPKRLQPQLMAEADIARELLRADSTATVTTTAAVATAVEVEAAVTTTTGAAEAEVAAAAVTTVVVVLV